ncbi:DNA polymerase III subunit beta family protein [Rhodococcus erythropolis]|uniref:DNA polymerase III subunit beta family protein n=1 Tax=Rhodococcus erythropolis TaxID=1833 RepID=UPI0036D929D2
MSITFEINRGDLAKAITIALKFAGKERELPMLCGINLSIIKGQLTITGTDRFRLGLVRIRPIPETADGATNPDLDGPGSNIGVLPRATATRLLRVIGGPLDGRSPNVELTSSGRELTVADGETRLTVTLVDEKFPDVVGILLDEMERPIDLDLWGVNTALFAAFKDAAWRKGDHATVRLSTASRPAVVRIGDHFIGCLMPVQIAKRGSTASDWKEFLTSEPERPTRTTKRASRAAK